MKIGDTQRTGRAAPVRRMGQAPSASGVGAATAATAARHVADTASIMGIPAAEITPKVRDAMMSLMSEVDQLRRELAAVQSRLNEVQQEADTDVLVPVLNRRAFVRELSRMISYTERYRTPASLVYIDLNNFKQVNDTLGHAAGDAVLEHVAGLLTKHVRESDIVGRIGGDEFAVILPQAGEAEAIKKAESLMHLIADKPINIFGNQVTISVSPGAAAFEPGDDAAKALARADAAMYEAKRKKRDGEGGGGR